MRTYIIKCFKTSYQLARPRYFFQLLHQYNRVVVFQESCTFEFEQLQVSFYLCFKVNIEVLHISDNNLVHLDANLNDMKNLKEGWVWVFLDPSNGYAGVLPDAFGQPYRAWRPSTSRGSPPLQRSIPQMGPSIFSSLLGDQIEVVNLIKKGCEQRVDKQ
ncbi:Hypothetical_protein [Hexamita inflata]|uniref:Hypothetical_protein n=1 Tax=Hexamita inflata TaxID=28002 RepID=A0AA86U6E9_9EUKA|nr:Hypothetical protein HINF_LOCUS27212 [Hexamita inflata]